MGRTLALWRILLLTAAALTAWLRPAQVPSLSSSLSMSDESFSKPETFLQISGELPSPISPRNLRDDWTGQDRPQGLPFRMHQARGNRPPCGVTLVYMIVDQVDRRTRRGLVRTEDRAVRDNLLEAGDGK